MNDLRTLIADLDQLAQSYSRRARANGAFHADNDYLIAQGARFDEAAWQLKLAVQAAKERIGEAIVAA